MRQLRNFLFYFIVVIALVIFFSPKRQLYYLGEKEAAAQNVVLSGESIHDWGWVFALKDGLLYYDDLFIARLSEVSLMPLGVFNSLTISSFVLSDEMQQFVPGTIHEIRIQHSVIRPLSVFLDGSGEFGEVHGQFHLQDRNLSLSLDPSALLLEKRPIWFNQLKKQPSGEYLYESTF